MFKLITKFLIVTLAPHLLIVVLSVGSAHAQTSNAGANAALQDVILSTPPFAEARYNLFKTGVPQEIAPFTSDYCSNWPSGPRREPLLWAHCCTVHDRAYWHGGTTRDRVLADRNMQKCIAETGHVMMSHLMYRGVRIFGRPYKSNPFRWGYGWPFGFGYDTMTLAQTESADRGWAQFCENLQGNEPYPGFFAKVCLVPSF